MQEEFPGLNAFIEYLGEFKNKHKDTPFLLDPVNFLHFKESYNILAELATAEGNEIETNITMNWFKTGSCSFNITTDDFVLRDGSAINKFTEAFKYAANFEIYPLLEEKIRIGVVFDNVMRPAL